MSKNKLRWFWYFSAVVVLCLIGVILYPAIIFSDTLYVVCTYVVVDVFALAVGYSMLRKLNMLASWKVAVYLAVVVVGSRYINFLLVAVESQSILLFALIAFTLLSFFNFTLSKIIFAVSVREATLIGILMGLIGTLLGILTNSVPN